MTGPMTAMLVVVAMLAGCSGAEQGVPGETPEESAALNAAAEMLDTSPDSMAVHEGVPLETESNGSGAAGDNSAR